MKGTIIFIHGMFQNAKSWNNWVEHFTAKGYNCIAESWPLHEGEPAELRANVPNGLGELRLATITDKYRQLAAAQTEKPIIIGHSVGGLITQILVNEGLAKLGVPVSTVAPNAMISFDWGFVKNSALITNPLKGDDAFIMDAESFHGSFANTMSEEAAKQAWQDTATNDSRNVLRDCLGEDGKVDLDLPHVPMLFIAGEEDQIIPYELCEKNAKAYTDEISFTDHKTFANRSHFICNEPGWEEVLQTVSSWIDEKENAPTYNAQPIDIES
ncbi:alpha/beta hydrolase [Mucilaginibacter aquatilis]|uniref:Alpha/beta fold hydrolase n=1 Tax=Mucilaginibacter aquatilis TaxID=1517760 RepID=A0A6I4I6E7_9SPHI|nr:alpha/beta hydrolase [Mucilaginibacter aquatilis]MVN89698.1 alpha/beta fold hydrolase [Mucilaginibacter aquatilis]